MHECTADPGQREEYVVLSAHLDHMGVGDPVDGDPIYNGAFDNASGVAVLLEVAHAFARLSVAPRRSVLFLAVTGEEQGLNGSELFAHHPTVPGRIVADVNLDMFLMLYPLRDVVASGKTFADRLLDRYHGDWNGDVSHVYEEFSF